MTSAPASSSSPPPPPPSSVKLQTILVSSSSHRYDEDDEEYDDEQVELIDLSKVVDEEETETETEPNHQRLLWAAVINLTLASVGAGILTFPFVFSHTGLLWGVVFSLVFAVCNALCNGVLLYYCRDDRHTYESLVLARLHPPSSSSSSSPSPSPSWLCRLINASVLIIVIGTLIGFLIIVGDMAAPVTRRWCSTLWCSRPMAIIVFAAVVALPLSHIRTYRGLTISSIAGVAAAFAVALGVCIRAFTTTATAAKHDDVRWSGNALETLVVMPLCFFAYGNCLQVVPIWTELPVAMRRRPRNAVVLLIGSSVLCALIYMITGVCGYITWGHATDGDILVNYPLTDTLMNAIKLLMALHIVLAFPMILLPGRHMLTSGRRLPSLHHSAVTIAMVSGVTLISVVAPSISFVFGVMGSSAGVVIIVVAPMVMLIKDHMASRRQLLVAYSGLSVAAVFAVFGTVMLFII